MQISRVRKKRIFLLEIILIPIIVLLMFSSLSLNTTGLPGGNSNPISPMAAPVGYDDSYETSVNTQLTIEAPGVLVNDKDSDGDKLQAIEDSLPSYGELVLSSDGSFRYLPSKDFTGSDKFTYIVSDGKEKGNTVTVIITVKSLNTPPVGYDDKYTTFPDSQLNVIAPGVLKNDTDADKDVLEALLDITTTYGVLILKTDGSFSYTPNKGFTGIDKFSYIVSDTKDKGNTITVVIEVSKPPNTPPKAEDDTYKTDQDTTLKVTSPGVLKNDTDKDGDALQAILDITTSNGSLNLYSDGSFDYEPDIGFTGIDKFSYIVFDGLIEGNTATVIINVDRVTNPSPAAFDDQYSTEQDETLHVRAKGVLHNDSDPNGDPLIAILDASTSYGALKLYKNGSFIYEPNTGYHGYDKFSYKAFDGVSYSNSATVIITIIKAQDPIPTESKSTDTKSSNPSEQTKTSLEEDSSAKTDESSINSNEVGADPALPVSATGPTLTLILTMGLFAIINIGRRKKLNA